MRRARKLANHGHSSAFQPMCGGSPAGLSLDRRSQVVVSKKLTALVAAGAMAVPAVAIGASQGDTNSLGAPGQVCKGIHTTLRAQLKELKGRENREARRELRREARAGFKACIRAAARQRRQHNRQEQQQQQHGQGHGQNQS